jgi:hypothetical protein
MAGTGSFLGRELSKFFEAVWLDLPAAAGKILLGSSGEKELRKAGWKAYDAWISVANELTNAVYSDAGIGEATGRVMESALRLRQISGAMATAFFGNLWPSLGLPTHSEIVAVRDELIALREELAAYAVRVPVSDNGPDMDVQNALPTVWKDAHLKVYRAAIGNGSVGTRSANKVQRHVAA